MRIADSVALVTGGASGLGLGVAGEPVAQGGRVVVLDLPRACPSEVVETLGERGRVVEADVTRPSEVEGAVAEAHAAFGRLDSVISCAGILRSERVLHRDGDVHSLDNFRRHTEVNLIGVFDVIRHAVRFIASNDPSPDGERGVIINVVSVAEFEGQVGQSAYAASKGGLVSMTLPLARELGPLGIRAVCICPGAMDTPMLASMPDAARHELAEANAFPLRLGRPHELGKMIAAVLENVFINGEAIRFDAGTRMSAR